MKLNIEESIIVKVFAEDYYSREYIEVKEGEVYSFSSLKSPKWIDWFMPSNANGFWNPILLNSKKRVKNVTCFKLCGTINQNEDGHFMIGGNLVDHEIKKNGALYFFANDHFNLKYYKNNHGFIRLTITRTA